MTTTGTPPGGAAAARALSRARTAPLTLLAALGALLLAAAPAPAAALAAPSDVSTRGTAPACVTRDVIKQKKTVTIRNGCGKAMHLKLVIDNGPDGQCWTYQNGEAYVWTWKSGSYGKVVTC
ncbi:hypothetical protein NX801_01505 [Streptomyces sp. LP05-1]|uniref:Uncharacterized protein n=1 Tax=Streptomyces pyxinae TaxID=2970734 RepID=A0ABT2CAC8_9ACTN|nr:hypothetical protein [Streptomyces sp. LP05-1]MCS0634363.1 hypothetical protein [Streptomyces sp. LP05-1]